MKRKAQGWDDVFTPHHYEPTKEAVRLNPIPLPLEILNKCIVLESLWSYHKYDPTHQIVFNCDLKHFKKKVSFKISNGHWKIWFNNWSYIKKTFENNQLLNQRSSSTLFKIKFESTTSRSNMFIIKLMKQQLTYIFYAWFLYKTYRNMLYYQSTNRSSKLNMYLYQITRSKS